MARDPERARSADVEEVVAPVKAVRLADMVDAIVEELHGCPLDGASRARVRLLYRDALIEVGSALSDALLEELARLHPGCQAASDDELRIDIVLLSGWLHGLRFGLAVAETPGWPPPDRGTRLPEEPRSACCTGGP